MEKFNQINEKPTKELFKNLEDSSSESDSDLEDENKELFSNNKLPLENSSNKNDAKNLTLNLNESEKINLNSKINSENITNNNNNNDGPIDIFDNVYEPETKKAGNIINYDKYYKQYILDPGNEGRNASRVLFLRSFNNWVKATMINKYTFKLAGNSENLSILDLCCGRGGDLEKLCRI